MSFYRVGDRGVMFGATARGMTFPTTTYPAVSTGRLWANVSGSEDYDREFLAMNVMKTARPWIGHLPASYGGGDAFVAPVLDADGYPQSMPAELASIGTLLFTEQATESGPALNGRYRFLYDGEGTFSFTNATVSNLTVVSPGVIEFDLTVNPASHVDMRILTINASNHPRNFRIFKTAYASRLAAGFITRPDYEWAAVKVLRFMDIQRTNQHHLMGHLGPGTEARATAYSWNYKGISVPEICQIANELGVNPWVCIPHTANDAYVTAMATTIRNTLNPALTCYLEWSNEIWNSQFQQTLDCFPAALARFGTDAGDAWMQYAGSRAAQCMNLFSAVFAGQTSRIVRVACGQLNYEGIETPFLNAPLWVALGNPAPKLSFDAYAITGYFTPDTQQAPGADTLLGILAGSGYQAAVDYAVSRINGAESVVGSLAELFGFWDYHRGVATANGHDLLMYEGGTHAVGLGAYLSNTTLTNFFAAFNHSPEMGQLYRRAMIQWDTIGDGGFCQFHTNGRTSQYGSWGAIRYIGDLTSRSTVLLEYNRAPLLPLDARVAVTGHSIPDTIYKFPFAGVIVDSGLTPDIVAGTGPYASAQYRWENDPAAPDAVRAVLTAAAANSFDLFLGIEAHGGAEGSPPRASVQTHITFSDAYGHALLWHNLAASKGAQTYYASFWRDDTAEIFGASWRSAQNDEAPLHDAIIDYVNANRAGGTPAMRLVPWLQVFMAVYDAIESGAITGVTMGDFFFDTVHAYTNLGTWVQIATVLAVMYRCHPSQVSASISLEFSGKLTIDTGVAAQLRPVIWAACLASPRTGLT